MILYGQIYWVGFSFLKVNKLILNIMLEWFGELDEVFLLVIFSIYFQLFSDFQVKIFEKVFDGVRKCIVVINIVEIFFIGDFFFFQIVKNWFLGVLDVNCNILFVLLLNIMFQVKL